MGRVTSGAGTRVVPLLFVLALLCGYGTWNYQRNLAAEAALPRPYRSYSDAQLEQLLAAYQGQVDALNERYESVAGQRGKVRDTQLLGEAVDEFQRVQRNSQRVRDLGAQASQEQASLDAIREEQALRSKFGKGFAAFLRRAFLPPS